MAGSINRRRKLLIDGSQRQLLGVYFVHFMVILVVFFAAMVFIFNQQVIRSGLSIDEKQEFATLMSSFTYRFWPAMWVLFLLMVLHAIYITHKIAGPLYRIRSVLGFVATGNLTARVKLRRGDYLGRDAAAVNDAIDEMDRRVGRMQEECTAAGDALDRLVESIEGGSRSDARTRTDELRSTIEAWKESLQEFETTPAAAPVRRTPKPATAVATTARTG